MDAKRWKDLGCYLLVMLAGCGAEPSGPEGEVVGTGSLGSTDDGSETGMFATGSESSGGTGSTDADSSSGGSEIDPPEVPDNEYCADVADWPSWPVRLEVEVLEIVNQRRSEGADCRTGGVFGPAGPLTLSPALMCAARVHSVDMHDRGFFDHVNPDGEGPGDRIDRAGYTGSPTGENIANGYATAEEVMVGWMGSDGHCANIMKPEWDEMGVGYFSALKYWTQTFGKSK